MRTLFAAGYIPPKHVKSTGLASRCAWCRRWESDKDRMLFLCGAKITHSICPSCEAEHFGPEAA